MKKISLLLVLILVVVLGAFADNPSTSFDIGTFVAEQTGLKVHDNSSNGVTYPTDVSSFANLNPVGTSNNPVWLMRDDEGGTQDGYRVVAVSVMTNLPGSQTVTATAGPMEAEDDASKKIGFKVTVGETETVIAKSDTPKMFSLIASIPDVTQLTFVTQEFRVDINTTDYESALVGRYTSTWLIELKSV